MAGLASRSGLLRFGFLDQDVAQVERLAGLDGEIPADLVSLVGDARGRLIADPVQCAGDQRGQGDPAVGVGAREVPVVPAVDVDEEVVFGARLAAGGPGVATNL
jgi:hypothetical protein